MTTKEAKSTEAYLYQAWALLVVASMFIYYVISPFVRLHPEVHVLIPLDALAFMLYTMLKILLREDFTRVKWLEASDVDFIYAMPITMISMFAYPDMFKVAFLRRYEPSDANTVYVVIAWLYVYALVEPLVVIPREFLSQMYRNALFHHPLKHGPLRLFLVRITVTVLGMWLIPYFQTMVKMVQIERDCSSRATSGTSELWYCQKP